MSDFKHIALIEYEQAPPNDLWQGLSSILDDIEASEKKFQEVGEYEVLPNANIWATISQTIAADSQAGKTNPPQGNKVPVISMDPSKKPHWLFFTTKKIIYIGVAASLVIAFFTIYNTNKQKNPQPVIASKPLNITSPEPTNPPIATTDSSAIELAVAEKPTIQPKKVHPAKIKTAPALEEAFVSNNIFEIEDEDSFFVTLANYVLPASLNGSGKASIRVDQYSSIYISTKMSMFMRGMYERSGKRNKPTRKARRSYKALRSWKKTSNKAFGPSNSQNVSDPFVLAAFLDKNRRI